MQINEIQQLNDNQPVHSSKEMVDKIRGSECYITVVAHPHTAPQFTAHHCSPADT